MEVLPELSATTVEIQTEALGLSATEVEQMITVPLRLIF
jgi:Cu/Ag efflux pump CusA